jgi:uncharacterized membrane protein
MTGVEGALAGPAGAYAAILAMALGTYACRVAGVLVMSRLRPTPRIERGLRALPGSIVVATVAPIAAQAGLPAFVGLAACLVVMVLTRLDLAALLAGLAAIAAARAIGI